MKFISMRSRMIASTSGHVIEFKKGEPTYVPPEARKDVMAAGLIPEDEAFELEPEKKGGPDEPTDPDARKLAMFDVFAEVVKAGVRENFTAHGVPHTKVLTKALGWTPDAKERDAAWEEFNRKS